MLFFYLLVRLYQPLLFFLLLFFREVLGKDLCPVCKGKKSFLKCSLVCFEKRKMRAKADKGNP